MSHATIILNTQQARQTAMGWISHAKHGTRVEFKTSKRSIPQNARLHAMLGEIAVAVKWHGLKLSVDDWKLIFMDGLKRELRLVPNLDGTGFVNLGRSTSKLTKEECTDLIELVAAFGANHGVTFGYDERKNAT